MCITNLTYVDHLTEKINELASLLNLTSSEVIICSYDNNEDLDFIIKKLKSSIEKVSFYDVYYEESNDLSNEIVEITKQAGFKFKEFGDVYIMGKKLVFSIFGIENALDKESIERLNLYRDLFLRINRPILIWINETYIGRLALRAPDFWRIRTKVFFFSKKEILNNKANALADSREYSRTIECYDQALEIDPNYDDALNNKGSALAVLQRYDEAIKCYDKALEIDPNKAYKWYNKGRSLDYLKKYDEAIKCYDKALEIDPNNTNALYYRTLSKTGTRSTCGDLCDASLWNHVINPTRYSIIDPCKTVTGILGYRKYQKNGDLKIRLLPDQEFTNLTNPANNRYEFGSLILIVEGITLYGESVFLCECKNFHQNVCTAPIGTHVKVVGSYVIDRLRYGVAGIRPVTCISTMPEL